MGDDKRSDRRPTLTDWQAWVNDLDAQVQAGKITLEERDRILTSRPLPEGVQEQITLTPEDEEILDRVWAQVFAEHEREAKWLDGVIHTDEQSEDNE